MTAATIPAAAVLVIEDDDVHARLAQIHLERHGLAVTLTRTGAEGLQAARQRPPELVLSSLHLADMDGLALARALSEESRTRHVPLILMGSPLPSARRIEVFESGADDYLARPLDYGELAARVRAHIRRAQRKPALNPLSGLPGNLIIEQEIRRLTQPNAGTFAVLYLDLNNFKAYNDVYGFPAGDEAIRLLAGVLTSAVADLGNLSDLVGHVGGDDFVVITTPDRSDALAQRILADFDQQVPDLYTPADRRNGYITAKDRQGLVKKYPLLGVVIAVVHNEHHPITSHWEVGELGAELKHFAKSRGGSNYVKDQRRG